MLTSCGVVTPLLLILVGTRFGLAADEPSQPDCLSNKDCPSDRLCAEFKCINPCLLNLCGDNTNCKVTNHIPICACKPGFSGPLTGATHRVTVLDTHRVHSQIVYTRRSVSDACSPTPPTSSQLCPSVSNRKGDGQKKFKLQSEKKNWHKAVVHCLSQDMRLATIETQEEHDRVVRQIQNANVKPNGRWWLGGADLGQPGDFLWYSTGRRFNYTNFPSGQPDNHIYENGEDEHCMELRTEWNYAWNDYVCHYNQYFVCEYYS